MRRICCAFAIVPLLIAETAGAQDVRFSAQVRPRFEFRDPGTAGVQQDFISMRTRLGATAALPENIVLAIQIQDVRFFGQDAVATATPANFPEVHQAYIGIERLGGATNVVRVGRQEIALGSQRLVGASDWAQRARAFDGVRASFGAPRRSLDLFSTQIADREAGRGFDASFHGAYAALGFSPLGAIELYGLYNRARTDAFTDQVTVGGRIVEAVGLLALEAEGAYQFGDRADRNVTAYMVRAAAGPSLPALDGRILLSFEHYSGGDPLDEEQRAFDTLFGTSHSFLGYADLFTSIPTHTAGRGIQDFAVRASITPAPGTELIANGHIFRAASDAGLASSRFGEELDLRVRHRVRQPLMLTTGLSYVWHGPALAEIGRLDRDMTFVYAMISASF